MSDLGDRIIVIWRKKSLNNHVSKPTLFIFPIPTLYTSQLPHQHSPRIKNALQKIDSISFYMHINCMECLLNVPTSVAKVVNVVVFKC